MTDICEKALEELTRILHKYTSALEKEEYIEDIHAGLLSFHRVVLILVEVHERTMKECGIDDSELKHNRQILEDARSILDRDMDIDITMPGGDA